MASTVDLELVEFVRAAKERGVADDFIVALLRQNGWSERRVFSAFSAFYTDALGRPVPMRAGSVEHSRDAFYYLLNFITLGFWTIALGQIWYALIARWFPDSAQRLSYTQSLRDEISWQVATVIVTFPIFVLLHNLIRRELKRRPDLYDSGIRNWLTYLALVIASIVVLADAVWFFGALLRGEITSRFILDSLVLLILGGGVFTYYLATMNPPTSRE